METLEQPPEVKTEQTQESNPEREQMLKDAAGAGLLGVDYSESQSAEPEQRAPATEEEKAKGPDEPINPDNSETDSSKGEDRPRGPDGKFIPKEQAEAKPDEQKPPEKPETEFSKKQKDRERQDKSWKALEAEKAQIRAQAEFLKQQQAALLAQQQQAQQQARTSPDGRHQYSAQEYQNAAQDFKNQAAAALEDNPEEAKRLLALADKASAQAQQVYQIETQQYQETERTRFAQTYDQVVAQEFERHPELQDEKHPIHAKLQHLLQSEPMFQITADGFQKAHRVAQLLIAEDAVSELTEKNKQLEAEVQKLRKATSISGSGPTGPSATVPFEKMAPEQQRAWLLRSAEQADRSAA